MRFWSPLLALLLPVVLAGCILGGGGEKRPPIRPRPGGPVTLHHPTSAETRQCMADLGRDRIDFRALPDRDFGGGCLVEGSVQLLDIGVPVAGLKSMRCPLALAFTQWVRNAVAPAARQILGSDLARVQSLGTFSCRGIIGGGPATSGKISEHGLANAVDVAGFTLADGRSVTIANGWTSDDPDVHRFLHVIHDSACKRFRTVLSPEYNAAHHDHFHLDMGRGPFCR